MNRDITKKMKLDCCRFMAPAIVASFLHRLITVAAPTAAAWMIGDMADHLLALDKRAIAGGMVPFLTAVVFQAVIAPLINLTLNLLLTKQGFAYDGFLMEKFIRLPLHTVQTTDAGAVMERLEEDSAAFCWNQMTLYAYPGAILLCTTVFGYTMVTNHCHLLFVLTIVLFASIPVFRAAHIGTRQTEFKKQVSEHNDTRKQMEQELYDAREFAQSFSLDSFFIHRLRDQFQSFLKKTGTAQNRMNAKNEIFDFLCNYGVQLGTVLVGAMLISLNKLTLGALLGGFLMLPTIRQCCHYIRDWVTELHDEKKYLTRLAFFYEAPGEYANSFGTLQSLDASNLIFTYPGSAGPVLDNIDFSMTSRENYRLVGENGSGKTTLLSILAGLYEPQSGIVCHGATVDQRRRSTALQEQDGMIFSGTIWDNLFLPESRRREAEQLLREMGLEKSPDYETTSEGSNLSPGERKKILLARALLRDAPFLLLDEPFNHLDVQGKQALISQLKQRKQGVLLISHQDLSPIPLQIKVL